jgi:hypothetical protein
VVEAVADGAAAAAAMDRYLGGDGEIYPTLVERGDADPRLGAIEGFAGKERVEPGKAAVEERKKGFGLVERAYDQEGAGEEAARCLRCDLRLQILPVTLPPERWLPLDEEHVEAVPASEGVYQLLDENKVIIVIKGTSDMRSELKEKLGSGTKAVYFGFEPDAMYSKRESELIQQFLQQFGKMPEGDGEGDEDDLF